MRGSVSFSSVLLHDVPMYPQMFATRLSDLRLLDYSAMPLFQSNIDDFDPIEVERLRQLINTYNGEKTLLDLTDEDHYKALGFVREQNNVIYSIITLNPRSKLSTYRNLKEETDMLTLRKAKKEEARLCYQFIESARAYHKSLGFEQWHPDYPTLHTIENDIENGIGFVFAENDVPAGYCCMIVGDEPAYHIIDGAWKTKRPYAVIHRMAFDGEFRGKGLSGEAFSLIKEACADQGIEAIRVDTQNENTVMQHILQKEGFEYCGLVTFDGGPKLAYEWNR